MAEVLVSSGTKTRRGSLLKIEEIIEAVMSEHQGLVLDTNWGERGLFCNSDRSLPKGTYLMTFKERDEESDSASRIGRDGVYRLNLGIPKATFIDRFSSVLSRCTAGRTINGTLNF